MANEPKLETDNFTRTRLIEVRAVIQKCREKMLLDEGRLARSRQVVSDSEKRLKGLREPPAPEVAKDEEVDSL